MKNKILITVFALVIALPAAAQFRTIAEAHEIRLSEIRLPQSDSGTIAFKACDDCPYLTKRVGADTQWMINGNSVGLRKFRAGIARIVERKEVWATVLHHLEEDRVTQVAITVPEDND